MNTPMKTLLLSAILAGTTMPAWAEGALANAPMRTDDRARDIRPQREHHYRDSGRYRQHYEPRPYYQYNNGVNGYYSSQGGYLQYRQNGTVIEYSVYPDPVVYPVQRINRDRNGRIERNRGSIDDNR